VRNPFKRRPDEWFRFDFGGYYCIVKDKGGIISPPGECVWMLIDGHGPWMYLEDSFLGLMKQVITEWRHDRHIAG